MLDAIYTNENATRNQKVKKSLFDALDKISKELGMDFEIYSGGQPAKGSKGKRVGSTNHDNHGDGGGAADVIFKKDGKIFDLESDPKLKETLVRRLKEEGVNQFGYGKGYMKGTTSAHIGMDNSGIMKVWGADKTRKTADPLISKTVGEGSFKNQQPTTQQTKTYESMAIPNKNPTTLYKLNNMKSIPVQDYKEWFPEDATGVRDWRNVAPMTSSKTSMKGEFKSNPNAGKITTIKTEGTGNGQGRNLQKLSQISSDLVPYLSNLYNASLKPGAVPRPVFNSPLKLERVSMDADITAVNNDYRASVGNADQTLDGNTAVPVKMFAKGMKFNQLSQVNQTERNQNTQISNQETILNNQIKQGNNLALYNTRLLETERTNAIQAAKSANLANASDKFMMQQNTKAQVDLENDKMELLLDADQYGTWKRFQEKKRSKEYKFGGPITSGKVFKKLKPIY
ncbi:MAG: hypothetical protein EKK63_14635 [Acinetobacter sp.]|uniref:hypothetical protein n=1 Tax=Acinetobacter sp. TaxID=472 RepID=UPI000FB033CE|nr:hypothetical protein [Acinetobacter sp.]RUP37534.1 MAG: hypothetical protein EKK63_14635 [Acinetobacter sp.]